MEVIRRDDGWMALDALDDDDFDLVFCALRVGDWRGVSLYRAMQKERPLLAKRFHLMASRAALEDAPPSAAGRVVQKPLDPEEVRALLGQGFAAGQRRTKTT